jgi:MATE family multidrug resistance protein
VVALFIVGTSEYAVVWLGTDWDHEVEKGVWRNNQEMMYEVTRTASEARSRRGVFHEEGGVASQGNV